MLSSFPSVMPRERSRCPHGEPVEPRGPGTADVAMVRQAHMRQCLWGHPLHVTMRMLACWHWFASPALAWPRDVLSRMAGEGDHAYAWWRGRPRPLAPRPLPSPSAPPSPALREKGHAGREKVIPLHSHRLILPPSDRARTACANERGAVGQPGEGVSLRPSGRRGPEASRDTLVLRAGKGTPSRSPGARDASASH